MYLLFRAAGHPGVPTSWGGLQGWHLEAQPAWTLSKDLYPGVPLSQQDRNRVTMAGVMSVCLPVWARPKVTSGWQVVKMPLEPGREYWGRKPALKSDPGSTSV